MANNNDLQTLTVAALIELLQGEDPNAKVIFSTNYGDYGKTQQALPIDGQIEKAFIEKTAYSNSGFAVVQDEDCYEEGEGDAAESYLVIR